MKTLPVLILAGALSGGLLVAKSVNEIKQLDCKSEKFQRKTCSVKGTVKALWLLRQKSDTPCVEGTSFGFFDDHVWVDNGCSARFEVIYATQSKSRWWNDVSRTRISCKSGRYEPNTCSVGGPIRSLTLRQQKSHSRCVLGVSYGYEGEWVWVSDGCEAAFEVEYKPGGSASGQAGSGRTWGKLLRCDQEPLARLWAVTANPPSVSGCWSPVIDGVPWAGY